jgi:hypothetical protein
MDYRRGCQVFACQPENRFQFAKEGTALRPVERFRPLRSAGGAGLSSQQSWAFLASPPANRPKRGCQNMIKPLHMPPDAYLDDQADKFDLADRAESERKLICAKASAALICFGEWITRGRGGVTNRAFRSDIVLLSISPQFLPTKRPSAAWVAREHGVSRQWASKLWREFAKYIAPYVQFRGQRFLNRRRGRGRQPQPDPVARA